MGAEVWAGALGTVVAAAAAALVRRKSRRSMVIEIVGEGRRMRGDGKTGNRE